MEWIRKDNSGRRMMIAPRKVWWAVSCSLGTVLFSSMTERLVTDPKARAVVVIGAFEIYLAVQCFAGIIL